MKAKIAVVVNLAGYPKGSPEDQRQEDATNSVLNSPSNVSELLTVLSCEHPDGLTQCLTLERCACKEIGGTRHLPFLKEMLDNLHEQYPDSDYFGFLNSDIIVTPQLWERLDSHNQNRRKLVIVQRADSKTGEINLDGADGFFVRRTLIQTYLNHSPDWVIGEPCWDTGLRWWCRGYGINPALIRDGEALHVDHEQGWIRRDTPTCDHNKQLCNTVTSKVRMLFSNRRGGH